MSFDEIIIWIMAIGILIGGVDRILGNRFGLGNKFEEGFHAMGPLALGMVGIITLAPVLANILGPVIIPIYTLIGADPAMFASILAIDMGGYQLAMELSSSESAGLFSGLIVASMLGCTIVFSIPVGIGLIDYEDRPFFAKGVLAGLTTIPLGALIGGAIAGFDFLTMLINLIPVIILSIILILGLAFRPDFSIKCALIFAKFMVIIITFGLFTSAFEFLTGVTIIPGTAPIMDGIQTVGNIGIILLGAFPILHLIVRVLEKPLKKAGSLMNMNSVSAAGIVISMANSIPVYKMIRDMDARGKVINVAWLVPATAALGDHLGFTGGVEPTMITAVIISKLTAGLFAIGVAYWLSVNLKNQNLDEKEPELNKEALN